MKKIFIFLLFSSFGLRAEFEKMTVYEEKSYEEMKKISHSLEEIKKTLGDLLAYFTPTIYDPPPYYSGEKEAIISETHLTN